jgi:GTP cyclohydrolase I
MTMTTIRSAAETLAPDDDLAAGGVVPLHVVGGRPEVDVPAAERAVFDLLVALGRDPNSDHLAGTPRRVAYACSELLTPREFNLTTFPNDGV